ncbi:MAG: prevent-host-death protein [Verrucomicrobiota bacterium]|nr:prevent-host-death protein [Verrucomicrobiota bacterium]
MTINITTFKTQCVDLIRKVEIDGATLDITRHGKVVARLGPVSSTARKSDQPWKQLIGTGQYLAEAGESVITELDFEAYK